MLKKIIITLIVFFTGVITGFLLLKAVAEPIVIVDEIFLKEDRIVLVRENYLTRIEINEIIIQNKEKYLKSYLEIVNNKEIVNVILLEALEKEVPVNIAFAMAFVESSFNSNAVNGNSSSYDYGLFQLNTKSFPNADYFDIKENTKIALSYFNELFRKTGSWEIAVIFYNSGYRRTHAPVSSLEHMEKVLKKEREYDNIFNERMKG